MIVKSTKDSGLLLAVILILLSFSESANGQLANQYSFSSLTGVPLGSMSGSTLIMGSNLDDSASAVIGIGFSFTFAGTVYTDFSVNSNGLMRLSGLPVSNNWTNGIATGPFPAIMPLWDDGHTGSNGGVRYLLSGTAPNRKLTIEWTIRSYSGETGNFTKTFQVWLFETTNVVQFVYGSGTNMTSASIGIAASSSDYQSISTPGHSSSTVTINNAVSSWPGSGRSYTFTPPVIQNCTGVPNAGTISGTNSICAGAATVLSVSGATPLSVSGISYQWQESDDNGVADPWSSVVGGSGANTLIYTTASLAGNRYYRMAVSCSFSGQTATTTPYIISVQPLPAVSVSPTSSVLCAGNSLLLTASGANTYTWTPAGGLSSTTGATVTASPSASTIYTVTGTNTSNGCSATATAILTTTVGINANAGADPMNICPGSSTTLYATANTSTTVYALSSIPYQLFPTTGFTAITSWTGNADDGSALVSLPFNWFFYGTTYSSLYIGTNGYLSFGAASTAYQAVAIPAATAPNNYIALCWSDLNPGSAGTISYGTVGTAPNRVFIVDFNGVAFYNASGSIATGQVCLFEDGHVEIHATTLDRGTSTAASVMGLENATGSSGTPVTGRNGGTWSVTAPEAWSFVPAYPVFNYSWSPSAGLSNPNSASPTLSGVMTSTIYTVTVSGGGGCAGTATASVVTGQPFSVSATRFSNNFCFGGTTSLSANAAGGGLPYSYSWTTGGTPIGATASVSIAPPAGTTVYTVQASDNCGNAASSTLSVTVLPPPAVTASTSAALVCGSGSVTLTANGANGYSWVPADDLSVPFGASVSAAPSVTTQYVVTGTDASGCTATASVLVSVVPGVTLQATATPTNLCLNSSSQLNANPLQEAPYALSQISYNPLPTAGLQSIGTWTSGGAGNDDYFGPVSLPFPFTFFTQTKSQLYIGSNGFITFGSPSTDPFSQLIPDPAHPNDVIALCWSDLDPGAGGTIRFGTTGISPNRIFIIDFQSVPFFGIASGSNVTGQIHLYESGSRIELHIASVQHNGSGALNGMGIENATGTRAHYPLGRNGGLITWNVVSPEGWRFDRLPFNVTYSWSPTAGLSNSSIVNPIAGPLASSRTYTVTATDNFGCTSSASLSLSVGLPLAVQATASAATICSGSSTTLQAVLGGGGEPYSIIWKQGATLIGTTGNLNVTPPLGTSTYTLTVTDACGGSGSSTVQVSVQNAPSVSVNSSNSLICGSGSVSLSASGASSYFWSPSIGLSATTGTSVTASPNGTTTYTVVGSISGCTASATRTITVAPAVQQLDVTADQISGCNPFNTTLHAQACFSAFTNYKIDSSSVDYVPSSSGFVTFNGRDDGSVVIPLPFPFRYFGNTYSSAYISTNGYLGFGSSSSSYATAAMPGSGVPNNFIALVWNDMIHAAVNSGVDTFTLGTPGSRVFVVRFNAGSVSFYDGTNSYGSFGGKIVLHESSNAIDLRVDAMDMGSLSGRNKVMGIENATGLLAYSLPGKNNSNWVQVSPITYTLTPSLQCTSSGQFTYQWSPAAGLVNTNVQHPALTNLTVTTIYTVVATSTDGCSRTATLSIQVLPQPPAPVVSSNGLASLCWDGLDPISSVTLLADINSAGPGSSLAWNGPGTSVGNSLTIYPDVVPGGSFHYQAIVTNAQGCSNSSLPVLVETGIFPLIASMSAQSGCPGDSITLFGPNMSQVVAADFAGVPASFNLINQNQIRLCVPPGALSGYITLSTAIGCAELSAVPFTVGTCGVNVLELHMFIQGYMISVSEMNAKKFNTGQSFDPLDCEDILVALIDPGSGAVIEEQVVALDVYGYTTANFAAFGSFYLRVNGPNIVETWSGTPVDFLGGVIPYDFTSSPGSAFAGNLFEMNAPSGIYSVFNGDVTQDGVLDASDLGLVDFDIYYGNSGDISSDVTGDGVVDASDLGLIDFNIYNGAGSVSPF